MPGQRLVVAHLLPGSADFQLFGCHPFGGLGVPKLSFLGPRRRVWGHPTKRLLETALLLAISSLLVLLAFGPHPPASVKSFFSAPPPFDLLHMRIRFSSHGLHMTPRPRDRGWVVDGGFGVSRKWRCGLKRTLRVCD